MRLIARLLVTVFVLFVGQQAYAAKSDRVPSREGVLGALTEILNAPERQPLPIERVREAVSRAVMP